MDPKRDMDERVNLEMEPEDALRALLGSADQPPDGVWDPRDDSESSAD